MALTEEQKAIIYWADESGISNVENYEKGFAPKGHPPVLLVETKKERINMLSAISANGSLRFMLYEDSMNQQRLIQFMRQMTIISKQKINILDFRQSACALWEKGCPLAE